jgi:hypothetical protein
MSDFKLVKQAIDKQLTRLANTQLFTVDIPDRDSLVDIYLNSFGDEIERQVHNCNCCKSFIRQYGNIVAIIGGEMRTIWQVSVDDLQYSKTMLALHNYVVNRPITGIFLTKSPIIGTDFNIAKKTLIRWEHFSSVVPSKYVSQDIGTKLSEALGTVQVFRRSLEEITEDTCQIVLDLIAQNSIYRGEEFKECITIFLKHKIAYEKLQTVREKELYVWANIRQNLRIRNTAIGTLLVNLSEGMPLDNAVGKFEKIVAPSNYKRPMALVTPKMVEDAKATLQELGLIDSLQRRYAVIDDLPVQQVIFIDRSVSKEKDIFDTLAVSNLDAKKLSKVEEITLENFITNVVPTAKSIELLLEGRHSSNLMSLTSAVDKEAPLLFPWSNDIAFAYTGDVADSMKQRVKDAGGQVEGALRFSIQWNTEGDNNIDFDAHAIEPDNHEISFRNKGTISRLSGMLDVDIINPNGKVAVENIIWERPPIGITQLFVHNYSSLRSTAGFTAEIEYEGQLYSFSYDKPLAGGEKVVVATIIIAQDSFKFVQSLDSSTKGITKRIWSIHTNNLIKIKSILRSPNFLAEDYARGNKHTFFILEDCRNPEPPRGFFNEFLKPELQIHRKVFEILGNKLRVSDSDNQLSGIGFSSTQRAEFTVKVTGSSIRFLKVKV